MGYHIVGQRSGVSQTGVRRESQSMAGAGRVPSESAGKVPGLGCVSVCKSGKGFTQFAI